MDVIERLEENKKKAAYLAATIPTQMPLWGDDRRAIPNEIVRSELFSANRKVSDKLHKNKLLFSQGDFKITTTGASLTQEHLDVFEGIIHLSRSQPEGAALRFSHRDLLKVMGRDLGGRNHQKVLSLLEDLSATSVTIENKKKGRYWCALVPGGHYCEITNRYELKLDRRLIALFDGGYTTVMHGQRKQLSRSPLAKFLQAWICSHSGKVYPTSVEYLWKLSGSDSKHLKHFRSNLKKALDRLKDVGVIDNWCINSNDRLILK